MTAAVHAGPGPRWPALIPPLLIAIPVVMKLTGIPLNNAWIIFALLFGLMLTGMPMTRSGISAGQRGAPAGAVEASVLT